MDMQNLLHSIYSMKEQLPQIFNDSTHVSTKQTISDADFSFSAHDDKYELPEAEQLLDKLKFWMFKLYAVVGDCLHHVSNLMDSFVMLGREMKHVSSLATISYRYCADHLGTIVQSLSEAPHTTTQLYPKLSELQVVVEKPAYSRPRCSNTLSRNSQVRELLTENQKLRKEIHYYEQERVSFMRLQKYYEEQLAYKQKRECSPCGVDERRSRILRASSGGKIVAQFRPQCLRKY